jgi:hypothetical protein
MRITSFLLLFFFMNISCGVKQASVVTNPPKVNKSLIKAVVAEGEFRVKEKPSIFLWPVEKNGLPMSKKEQLMQRGVIIKLSDERDAKDALKSANEELCKLDESKCTEKIIDETIELDNQLPEWTEKIAKAVDETFPIEKNFLGVASIFDGSSDYVISIEKGKVLEIRLPGFQKSYSDTMFTNNSDDSRFKISDINFDSTKKILKFDVPWLNMPNRPKSSDESKEDYLKLISVLGNYHFELELTQLKKSGFKRYSGEFIQTDRSGKERVGRATLDGQISSL